MGKQNPAAGIRFICLIKFTVVSSLQYTKIYYRSRLLFIQKNYTYDYLRKVNFPLAHNFYHMNHMESLIFTKEKLYKSAKICIQTISIAQIIYYLRMISSIFILL